MMNTAGFAPLDVRVLVRPDPVEERSKGGIILPDEHREQQKYATVKATLVALGANAFAEAKSNPDFTAPEPGQRVLIAKYGGIVLTGEDGADYRIMNDEDVIGVITEGN